MSWIKALFNFTVKSSIEIDFLTELFYLLNDTITIISRVTCNVATVAFLSSLVYPFCILFRPFPPSYNMPIRNDQYDDEEEEIYKNLEDMAR